MSVFKLGSVDGTQFKQQLELVDSTVPVFSEYALTTINRRTYSWNPLFRKVMQLKDKAENIYLASANPDMPINLDNFILPDSFETTIDRWIALTHDAFWSKIRPFLCIKQDSDTVLFKYANLAVIYDKAQAIGLNSESDLWHAWGGLLQFARSITINLRDETIETCPFDKFFNIGQIEESSWQHVEDLLKSAKTVEYSIKMDGSIFICRFLREKNEYRTHTSGSLRRDDDGANEVLRGARQMFYAETPVAEAVRNMVKQHPEQTFMFEYISQNNPIVVHYEKKDEGLYLIGIRDNATGDCWTYSAQRLLAQNYPGVRTTSVLSDRSWNEIIAITKEATGDQMEGFVINIDGHLFKLKTDDYLKIHRFIGENSSPNRIIRAVADGEFDDILSKIPENSRQRFIDIAQIAMQYNSRFKEQVDLFYERIPSSIRDSRKDAMVWIDANVQQQYVADVKNVYLGRGRDNYLKIKKGKDIDGNDVYKYVTISDIDPNFKNMSLIQEDE